MHPGTNTIQMGRYTLLSAPAMEEPTLRGWHEKISRWKPAAELNGAVPLSGGAVFQVGGNRGPVVFKRHSEHGWKGLAALAGAREPPLRRAFRLGMEAVRRGLHTPSPLAYFERREKLGYDAVLVTSYVSGDSPWNYLQKHPREKTSLFTIMAREIAHWHARGFRHRDLKGPNLLFDKQGENLYLLDLVGARSEFPVPSESVRSQDLGRLKASALSSGLDDEDWVEFIHLYQEFSRSLGIPVTHPESFDMAVTRRASRKIRRNQQNSRPIS